MTFARTCPLLVCFGIALCVPLTGASQTTAGAAPARQPPNAYADVSLNTAQRLEGRLFFTAQERQRIDETRKRGLVLNDDGKAVEAPSSVLNGFVKRNDGSTTVWVDGDVRWNAKDKNADGLVPSDVGGPAAYVKVSDVGANAVPRKPTKRPKKPAKAASSARTILKPPLLP